MVVIEEWSSERNVRHRNYTVFRNGTIAKKACSVQNYVRALNLNPCTAMSNYSTDTTNDEQSDVDEETSDDE